MNGNFSFATLGRYWYNLGCSSRKTIADYDYESPISKIFQSVEKRRTSNSVRSMSLSPERPVARVLCCKHSKRLANQTQSTGACHHSWMQPQTLSINAAFKVGIVRIDIKIRVFIHSLDGCYARTRLATIWSNAGIEGQEITAILNRIKIFL